MVGDSEQRGTSVGRICQSQFIGRKLALLPVSPLAFNAKIYADYSARSVVLLDHSLKLLKIAKSRLKEQLRTGFAKLKIPFQCRVEGNMAFIN